MIPRRRRLLYEHAVDELGGVPMLPIQLAAFLVLFGAGLAFAEYGSLVIGILLTTAGYGSAQTILKVARKLAR